MQVLGGKLEYEQYREGNEYSIIFHGHEIKVGRAGGAGRVRQGVHGAAGGRWFRACRLCCSHGIAPHRIE